MRGIDAGGSQYGLAFHMQSLRSRLVSRVSETESEPDGQSGGGQDAQPLCEFAMYKTVPSATSRQAVPGGDGVCAQVERTDGAVLFSYAAAIPASGTVLAMRRVRCGLDAGARPKARDRFGAAVPATGSREHSHGGGVQRESVDPLLDSRIGLGAAGAAMRAAVPHAHGDMPSRVLDCFENTGHGLRTDLLGGAA